MPSTSSASRGPPSWCSVGGREYRQPCVGVQLTKCALRARAIASACCPITLHTILCLVASRAASCHAVNHASVQGTVDSRVPPPASQVHGSISTRSTAAR